MHIIVTNQETGQTIAQHGIDQARVNQIISRISAEGNGGIKVDVYPESTQEQEAYRYSRRMPR